MIVLLSLLFLASVDGCARTADTGTGTGTGTVTTLAPGVTTVATATTVAGQNCNACMPSQVTLGPDPNDGADSHSPVVPPVVGTQNGCATLTVTCMAMTAATTLMTFQNGLGGPAPAATVTAVLVCNTMGVYQLGDINGPAITEVHCFG